MRKIAATLAVLCVFAASGTARADGYSSSDLGFSAQFPAAPEVSAPEGSEKDDKGNFISQIVSVASKKQGEYMAAVFEDTFIVPTPVNVSESLTTERDNFLKGMSATLVDAHEGLVGGHRAAYFTYAVSDNRARGQGLVVVIDAAKPKVFLVITMNTSKADDGEKAALDAFFASFKLLPGV